MPHVLPALNEHIRRVARREIRAQTIQSQRATAQYRRDIAELKRAVRAVLSRLNSVEKNGHKGSAPSPALETAETLRFRADGLRSHRAKLGLSARDYGKLVGVSGLTIYHWEAGKAKPRRKQLAALASVRGIGKREAFERLQKA